MGITRHSLTKVDLCPRCRGRLTLLAVLTDVEEAGRFARRLGDPSELPPRTAARGPP